MSARAEPVARSERFVRKLLAPDLTFVGAARIIAAFTLAFVVAAGVLIRYLDHATYPNVWLGMWWSMQTITSVGYGDVVPHSVAGRLLAALLMINGIALLTVVIAATSAAFVEGARRRAERETLIHDPVLAELKRISARLDELERP
jgi:voltage-gated potassium channel